VFAVTSGITYCFAFNVLYQSKHTANGLKLGLTFPAAAIVSANVFIPAGADGTGQVGWITASGDSVTAAGVEATGTTYVALIDGTIRPTANGNIAVQYAAEVSTTEGVIIKQESAGFLIAVP